MSPDDGLKYNDNSHDNFLKTGDNHMLECINLAEGNITNFVDHEASLDFLTSSNVVYELNYPNNFNMLMVKDIDTNNFIPRERKLSGLRQPKKLV